MKKHILITLALACALLLSACSASGGDKTPSPTDGASKAQQSVTDEDTQVPRASESAGESDSKTDANGPYHKITAEEAKQMIESSDVTIVDVRTEEEYADGHVPGAILVPLQTIGDTMPESLPDTDARLIVYCRSGVRSKQASDQLVALGYKNIYDMGGIIDWPYETEEAQTP